MRRIDLNEDFGYPDNPSFTKEFWKSFNTCIGVSLAIIGLITAAVINADAIDRFFSNLFKALIL